jgi:hypothetical protein
VTRSRRTRVYLTVDVECAEERSRAGGGVQPAMGYDLRVFGQLANRATPLGIERLMEEWERWGHRATFYVEPLGSESFGHEGLAAACSLIRQRGHDVQMHAHPCQLDAFWHSGGRSRRADDMSAHSQEQQAELLKRGIAILVEAGVPRESLVSFRAGNFGANNATWRAMSDVGLLISSSYNLGYRHKSVFVWPVAEAGLFAAEAGVWELPMTVFRQPFGGYRHLQLKAVGAREAEAALQRCWETGIEDVTFLTHSFEALHFDSIERREGRPNAVVLRRLTRLGRFLKEHRDKFEVLTVADLAARIRDGSVAARRATAEVPAGTSVNLALRVAGQLYQRAQSRWAIP